MRSCWEKRQARTRKLISDLKFTPILEVGVRKFAAFSFRVYFTNRKSKVINNTSSKDVGGNNYEPFNDHARSSTHWTSMSADILAVSG